MSIYSDLNRARWGWIESQIGADPMYRYGLLGREALSGTPEQWAEVERWNADAARLNQEYLNQLSPADRANFEAHMEGHNASIEKTGKILKPIVLATIAAAAGGSALTAAGVIGETAAATVATAAEGTTAAGAGLTTAEQIAALQAAGLTQAEIAAVVPGAMAPGTIGAATAAGGGLMSGVLSTLGGVGGLVNAGLGVASAITGAIAARNQAEEAQATAEYNAQEAEAAARNATLRGEEVARDVRRQGSLIEGAQRATMAARGLNLNEGTPKAAIDQTRFFSSEDQATARSNAAREAQTYRRQGSRYQAQASSINPSLSGGLTLASGLATVAARWYRDYKPGP